MDDDVDLDALAARIRRNRCSNEEAAQAADIIEAWAGINADRRVIHEGRRDIARLLSDGWIVQIEGASEPRVRCYPPQARDHIMTVWFQRSGWPVPDGWAAWWRGSREPYADGFPTAVDAARAALAALGMEV